MDFQPNEPAENIGLTFLVLSTSLSDMHSIKISSKVDESTWNELKELAAETHQNVSGLLTEAIREYVTRKRVRPVVLNHLEQSISENEDTG